MNELRPQDWIEAKEEIRCPKCGGIMARRGTMRRVLVRVHPYGRRSADGTPRPVQPTHPGYLVVLHKSCGSQIEMHITALDQAA